MSSAEKNQSSDHSSRREFLKTGSVAAIAGTLASGLNHGVHAAGSDIVKIGLLGCGGRGKGAARQALNADPANRLVAVGDAFADLIDPGLKILREANLEDQIDVKDDHKFSGFDAYKKVIDAVDVVLLATPPRFRPEQLAYAVKKGVHAFVEKPIAVDAPGVRSVQETCQLAEKKGLSIVSGLCWRYDNEMRATFDEIHKGTAGEITSMRCSYNTGELWRRDRQPAWSDMENQVRNWMYYTWLSGDFINEQHIHSIDKMAWAMQDEYPIKATGTGGRIVRTDKQFGHVYDHFAVEYVYKNGIRAFSRCRQQNGTARDVTDHIYGTAGIVDVFKHKITGYDGKKIWRYKGKKNNMYQTEHNELFASIKNGTPINNGYYMSMSTMMAILGRMVAYSGQEITMEKALNSQQDLTDVARSSRLVTSRRKIEAAVVNIQKALAKGTSESKWNEFLNIGELEHASSHIDQAKKAKNLFNDTLKKLGGKSPYPDTSLPAEKLVELNKSIKEYVDISNSKSLIQDSSDFEWGDLDFPAVAIPGMKKYV
jgi:myo-inositol 2-dehydrogenase / D-chiro-inositol 1-dehydrogenase